MARSPLSFPALLNISTILIFFSVSMVAIKMTPQEKRKMQLETVGIKGDLPAFGGMKVEDYVEYVGLKKKREEIHPNIESLLTKVDKLQETSTKLYNTNKEAIDKMVTTIKKEGRLSLHVLRGVGPPNKRFRGGIQVRDVSHIQQKMDMLMKQHKSVIMACKFYILGLFSLGVHTFIVKEEILPKSERGLAFYVRVHAFIHKGDDDVEENEFTPLAKIYRVSTLQAPHLDEAIFDYFIDCHVKNKKWEDEKEEEGTTAVVAGGGPAGRWTTLLAFMAGFNPVNVEFYLRDEYLRKRALRLDSIWFEHLNLLGTLFDTYTEESSTSFPVIYINEELHAVYVDICRLEEVLGKFHDKFAAHLAAKKAAVAAAAAGDADPLAIRPPILHASIELIDGAKVDHVLFPGAQPDVVETGDEDVNANIQHFRAVILDNEKRQSKRGDKAVKLPRYQKFGVFCNVAGASNNLLRNEIHGVPRPNNFPKGFFVVVAERIDGKKPVYFNNNRFFVEEDMSKISRIGDLRDPDKGNFQSAKVREILDEYLDKKADEGGCEAMNEDEMQPYRSLKKSFDELDDLQILYAMAIYSQYDGVRIAGLPPDPLKEFNQMLLRTMDRLGWSKNDKEARPCHQMRTRVNDYFFACLFRMMGVKYKDNLSEYGWDPTSNDFINVNTETGKVGKIEPVGPYKLKLESHSLNKQVFDVVQGELPYGADYYVVEGKLAIFLLLSDGWIGPHFATTIGMSLARWTIVNAMDALAMDALAAGSEHAHFPTHGQPKKKDAEKIIDDLNNGTLVPVKKDALLRASRIDPDLDQVQLEIIPKGRKDRYAMRETLRFINTLAKDPKRRVAKGGKPITPVKKYDFAIECYLPVMVYSLKELQRESNVGGVRMESQCVNFTESTFKLHLYGGEKVYAAVTPDGRIARRLKLDDANEGEISTKWEYTENDGNWDVFQALKKLVVYATAHPSERKADKVH